MLDALQKELANLEEQIQFCINNSDGYTYRKLLEHKESLLRLIDIYKTI